MTKDLISIFDLSKEDIYQIFKTSKVLKDKFYKGQRGAPLQGKTLGMIFHKPSTRTRVSFEVGMYQLGGYALFLSKDELQLKRGETIQDTAKTLSKYLDGIMIRTYRHRDVIEFAEHATIPVINGLTDREHPCQVLSDAFTIMEQRGGEIDPELSSLKGLKVAYIGDGNNVANSLIHLASKAPIHLAIASPPEYQPNKKVLEEGGSAGASVQVTQSPEEAVQEADFIYTDVWASMGKDVERETRLKVFEPYQVNAKLLSKAKKDYCIMHCLPAHRGEEITDEVMDGEHSVVFEQAENRLHVQKAIMVLLMGQRKE